VRGFLGETTFYGQENKTGDDNFESFFVGNNMQNNNATANEEASTEVEHITEISQLFPNNDTFPLKIPLFNPSILQTKQIYQDYNHEPFPFHVVENIKNVCITYVKCGDGSYFNANAWEYDLILGKIIIQCVQEFSKIYQNKQTAEEKQENEISDLVEIMINHSSFIDPVAACVWNSDERNERILKDILTILGNVFRNLQFKIGIWAWDLVDGMKK
jgi:hypothetical protein